MRDSCFLASVAVLALVAGPDGVRAQWPGEITGIVVDALDGRPLDGVVVEASPGGATAVSDAAGRFALRGLDPGSHTLEARRLGYASLRRSVPVVAGRGDVLHLALRPATVPVEPLRVAVDAADGVRVSAGAPGALGSRSAADLLRGVPGVTVSERGPGGAATASIRASGAGAVLVLLDGVPLNDPVTGEADLSSIPASALASATVLPGARGARYGPGAEGGVILLESRASPPTPSLTLGSGSLGRRAADAAVGGEGGGLRWSAAASHDREHGRFAYVLPAAVGGASGVRRNAATERTAVSASLEAGALRVRALHDRMERGLPGVAYAPSPHARQRDARTQLSLSWSDAEGASPYEASAWVVRRDARLRDPTPPAGLPYDDALRADGWGVRGAVRRALGAWVEGAAGVDLRGQGVDSGSLTREGRRTRTDGAIHGSVAAGPLDAPGSPLARITGRLHRDGRGGAWRGSHEVALGLHAGALALRLAHRSAWTPPDLADLFFREGVGVRPNPDLRAERVPSELELALTTAMERGAWGLRAGATLYRSDVTDMVVWAPDFRFVWSPRNVDVRRSGAEAWARLRVDAGLPGTLVLDGSVTHARATYDRPGDPDLQLAYRPRDAATLGATWSADAGALALEGRYTGLRYPVPARVNALPGFWTWDATATRPWRVGAWTVETRLRVERLFDATDALIFGYPHPGRTLTVDVALQAPLSLSTRSEAPIP